MEAEVRLAEMYLENEEQQEQQDLQELHAISKDFSFFFKSCSNINEDLSTYNDKFRKKWEELQKTQFLLEAKQLKLLSELQSIYPITISETNPSQLVNGIVMNVYCIRGIELLADMNQQRDDELISSALGYVVHLLLLASKYLEIPLRYQLFFYASRSMIRDPVSGSGQALPLFRRGTEKERFDRALAWLKKDIEQLILTRGISYDANRDILYNLNQLFACELCSSLAF